jgi:alkyl hydroperoxide reductase subunit AhpC
MNTQVLGISIDHKFANKAWADSIGGVTFPLLSDFWPHGDVAKTYGVFRQDGGMAERAVFIIDAKGVVRYIDVHDIGEEPDIEQIFEELAKL